MRVKLEVEWSNVDTSGYSAGDALYGLSANGEQVKRGMDTNQMQLLIENQLYGYDLVSHQHTPLGRSCPSNYVH